VLRTGRGEDIVETASDKHAGTTGVTRGTTCLPPETGLLRKTYIENRKKRKRR